MAHVDHDKAVRQVYVGLVVLAVITLIEVIVSLFGKGHIIDGVQNNNIVFYGAALIIILLSLYKAKYIIYEFMHMRHEVPMLAKTVLLPMVLLIWAMIAFFVEGSYWKHKNDRVKMRKEVKKADASNSIGVLHIDWSKEDII